MHIEVDSKDDIIEKSTDDRGRLTLGAEYADREVKVGIIDVSDE